MYVLPECIAGVKQKRLKKECQEKHLWTKNFIKTKEITSSLMLDLQQSDVDWLSETISDCNAFW